MQTITSVAQFIAQSYKDLLKNKIDKNKLYKLLYFAQREHFALSHEALFKEPLTCSSGRLISKDVAEVFDEADGVIKTEPSCVPLDDAYMLNNVILEYGLLTDEKISSILRDEDSWVNAKEAEEDEATLKLSDIKNDAEKAHPYGYAWSKYRDNQGEHSNVSIFLGK